MRIRVEPKDFFMYSVFLGLNQDCPEPEDEGVSVTLEPAHIQGMLLEMAVDGV